VRILQKAQAVSLAVAVRAVNGKIVCEDGTTEMSLKTIPTIRAHLSKPFSSVIGAGTYTFDESRIKTMRDRAIYVVEQPCRMIYDEPELVFEASPGRYVWMTIVAGKVVEILAGIVEQALSLNLVYEQALQIDNILQSLPFEEGQSIELRLADIRKEMAAVVSQRYELPVARYWRNEVEWTLRLDWLGSSAPSRENAYVLVMRWSSKSIEDRCMDQLYRKRSAIHGDENKALPMSVWMTQSKEL